MKLNSYRAWMLKQFGSYGWSIGRPDLLGTKKWQTNQSALVSAGMLEPDGYGNFRVTDAGRAALASMENGK